MEMKDSKCRTIIKPIIPFTHFEFCFHIGDIDKKHFIYKYMDMEAAIQCLKNGCIRFVEPTVWPDNYESRFYTADYNKIIETGKRQIVTPRLYACCFTMNKTSEAAWKIYSSRKSGLASRCVQFRLHKTAFRKELENYAKNKHCRIYEGYMNYSLSDKEIMDLHNPNNINYNTVFLNNFCLDNYLSLLLLKRQAFYYENEYRFFIIPEHYNKDEIYPKVNWKTIIDKIFVTDCSEIEMEIFYKYLSRQGIAVKIEKFNLMAEDTKRKNIVIGIK